MQEIILASSAIERGENSDISYNWVSLLVLTFVAKFILEDFTFMVERIVYFLFLFYLYLYIYPPDSQESDGGAIHRVSNYPDLLPEMPRYLFISSLSFHKNNLKTFQLMF